MKEVKSDTVPLEETYLAAVGLGFADVAVHNAVLEVESILV